MDNKKFLSLGKFQGFRGSLQRTKDKGQILYYTMQECVCVWGGAWAVKLKILLILKAGDNLSQKIGSNPVFLIKVVSSRTCSPHKLIHSPSPFQRGTPPSHTADVRSELAGETRLSRTHHLLPTVPCVTDKPREGP